MQDREVSSFKGLASLSDRERQVLAMAAEGLLDKEIAPRLGISLNTLRTYWSRIRSKIGEAPRTALAAVYIAEQIRAQNLEGEMVMPYDWEIDLDAWTILRVSDDDPTGVIPPGVVVSLESLLNISHPDDRPGLEKMLEDAKDGKLDEYTYFARFYTPTGPMLGHAIIKVLKDEEGCGVKLLGRRLPNIDTRAK
jgi:DNA-binding CsgD family transcriptional regulator